MCARPINCWPCWRATLPPASPSRAARPTSSKLQGLASSSWKLPSISVTPSFIANERFHLRLLEIEGNRWRCQMVNDLRRVMKLNRHHSLFKQGRLAESLGEHRAVMKAISKRDAAAAARLMREHFENGLTAATAGA